MVSIHPPSVRKISFCGVNESYYLPAGELLPVKEKHSWMGTKKQKGIKKKKYWD